MIKSDWRIRRKVSGPTKEYDFVNDKPGNINLYNSIKKDVFAKYEN
ncbi:hypothetical protein CHCC20335_1411 [Bacillus paralicheniformis]|nr:hypothetical protein CHCC20335_1411 [Bacillus paralicheniformis]